jgi:hypothetical protein
VANGVTSPDGAPDPATWLQVVDGGLEPGPGVVVVELREAELGAGFGAGSWQSGVARLDVDGQEQYAAYRAFGTLVEVVPGPRGFASLDDFERYARQQYASGAGLR